MESVYSFPNMAGNTIYVGQSLYVYAGKFGVPNSNEIKIIVDEIRIGGFAIQASFIGFIRSLENTCEKIHGEFCLKTMRVTHWNGSKTDNSVIVHIRPVNIDDKRTNTTTKDKAPVKFGDIIYGKKYDKDTEKLSVYTQKYKVLGVTDSAYSAALMNNEGEVVENYTAIVDIKTNTEIAKPRVKSVVSFFLTEQEAHSAYITNRLKLTVE
ncbi:hypothetical protein JANET_10 [Bacillus phage Janet]|nr:hypothetical protein JANET_10 [Bacillus phage Janet]